jgi:RND family efflux transporter MFP subunit
MALMVGAGVCWGGWIFWRQVSPALFSSKRPDVVPTVKVTRQNIAEEIITVGRLRAVFSTELRSEVNGRIVKILAADGDTVGRGREIVQLDQQDLLTQLQEIERSIEAARLRAEQARRDWERLGALNDRGLVAGKDAEDARTALALAENEAAMAEARAANLRDRLGKTIIRAPHDGTLLLRDLTEGQVITGVGAQSGGTLLGEVADLSAIMVRTNINEIDVARLKLGDIASVRIDPLRSVRLPGHVRRIATSAVENQQDRTRVFPVDVDLEVAEARARPGMSATITFTLSRVENATAVLLSAVFASNEADRYVFVRTLAGGFEVRTVEIGIADTRHVEIVSGLAEGDEIATARPLLFTGQVPGAFGVGNGEPPRSGASTAGR